MSKDIDSPHVLLNLFAPRFTIWMYFYMSMDCFEKLLRAPIAPLTTLEVPLRLRSICQSV